MKKISLNLKKPRLRKRATASTSQGLTFKQSIILLLVAAVGLFVVSGYYWYKFILINPDRVMSDMLDKSLQTRSVFKSIEQIGSEDSSASQQIYAAFSPQHAAQSITRLQERTEVGKATVVTETLGTKDADYVRYNSIDIEGSKSLKGAKNVVGVWGKQASEPESGQPATFLNEALFVAVPFGSLNHDQRAAVKQEIDSLNLYEVRNSDISFEGGRPVMTYDVKLSPQKLVQVLAKYAEVTDSGASSQLNPTSYQGAPSIDLKIEVDLLSRHLRSVDFLTTGRREVYGGYNAYHPINIPEQTISIMELQQRVQGIEQELQQ